MDPPSGSDSNWIEERIDELIEQYGAVPPPWFMIPDTHPHEIGWRMGAGEAHIMVFSSWWEKEKADLDEEAKIEYFRKWPPPPRWLVWMIEVLWDIRPWESSSDPESFDYSPYFARTEELGFGTQEDYQTDLNDPKWYA